ncbi:MAG: ATP-binding domain-containing protein [Paracoccaceae bacterium]|nr:ATP-binding domain-containing protein [Paracoccaceae bacterium]
MLNETWWRQLSELDDHQKAVIGLPADGSFLVIGPPGSGKTNLLLLRSNYLSRTEHPNLAVVVFNRTLCNFIRAGAERYTFDPKRVQTIGQLFNSVLEEAGTRNEFEGEFAEVREARAAAVREVLSAGQTQVFDTILLDEAQDYLIEELEVIRALCHDVFLVADSRQQIYGDSVKFSDLAGLVSETHTLPFNYRSGPRICQVADGIGNRFVGRPYEAVLPSCNYPNERPASTVEVVTESFREQCETIADRLRVQLRAYSDEMLAVITPRVEEVRAIAEFLEQTDLADRLCVQSREDGYQPLDESKPIWVSTVHSAKGLEFGAVHFAGADLVARFRGEQKRLAYTGVTRAKISLTVYHERPLPAYFDSAFNDLRPLSGDRPDIGIAFGDG